MGALVVVYPLVERVAMKAHFIHDLARDHDATICHQGVEAAPHARHGHDRPKGEPNARVDHVGGFGVVVHQLARRAAISPSIEVIASPRTRRYCDTSASVRTPAFVARSSRLGSITP